MGRSAYKAARLRDAKGRWPVPQGMTPGRKERVHDVPPADRPWLGANELVDHARTSRSRHNPHKGARLRRNTRRGVAGGSSRSNRGRKGVIERH